MKLLVLARRNLWRLRLASSLGAWSRVESKHTLLVQEVMVESERRRVPAAPPTVTGGVTLSVRRAAHRLATVRVHSGSYFEDIPTDSARQFQERTELFTAVTIPNDDSNVHSRHLSSQGDSVAPGPCHPFGRDRRGGRAVQLKIRLQSGAKHPGGSTRYYS